MMARKMFQKTSQSSNLNIEREANDNENSASDDSSDVDIYIDEPTEIPPPPSPAMSMQQNASPSKRSSKGSNGNRAIVTSEFEMEWNDADHERQYDLTPLGEKNTNRRSARSTPTPSYSIDPWENARAKEIALAEKLKAATVVTEGYVCNVDRHRCLAFLVSGCFVAYRLSLLP
jgi:hypothetical protein